MCPSDDVISSVIMRSFFPQARLEAATSLIQNITVHRGELVEMTKNVCNAYIELAYLDVNHLKKETGTQSILG